MSSSSARAVAPPARPAAAPAVAPARFALWPAPDLGERAPDVAAAAQARAESFVDEAYRRGYAEGVAAARAEAERVVGQALRALGGAAESLAAVQAAIAAEAEEHLAALAVAVAQQVILRAVEVDPAWLREAVRRAIELLPPEPHIEVRLHPDDLAALEGQLDLAAHGGRRFEVQWIPDPQIERGGYLIETAQRFVDGRVDAALQACYDRLRHA